MHRRPVGPYLPPDRSRRRASQHNRFTPDGLRHHRQALGTDDIRALVQELEDIVAVLANAEPGAKSDVCRELGVTLRYDPSGTI